MTLCEKYKLDFILALLPLPVVALLYGKLPAQIPTHWNVSADLVTYSGKGTIWILAVLPLVMLILFRVLPKIDPKRQNYARFLNYYNGFCLFMLLFLDFMLTFTLSESFHPGHIPIQRVMPCLVGLLFVFLGNFLPKVKHNYFIGVRTPWTLSSPDIWNRTHRLTGHLFFWFGLLLAVTALFLPSPLIFAFLIVGIVVIVLLPFIFSYRWFHTCVEHDESTHDL